MHILQCPSEALCIFAAADLGMFSMFGRTAATRKEDAYRPENVGQQLDIFWPEGIFMATLIRCYTTISGL